MSWVGALTKHWSRLGKVEEALHAANLQHVHQGMGAERNRVTAEDKAGARAMGYTVPDGEEMGDIIIADNYDRSTKAAQVGQFSKYAGMALLTASIVGAPSLLAWKYLDARKPADNVETIVEPGTGLGLKIKR